MLNARKGLSLRQRGVAQEIEPAQSAVRQVDRPSQLLLKNRSVPDWRQYLAADRNWLRRRLPSVQSPESDAALPRHFPPPNNNPTSAVELAEPARFDV